MDDERAELPELPEWRDGEPVRWWATRRYRRMVVQPVARRRRDAVPEGPPQPFEDDDAEL